MIFRERRSTFSLDLQSFGPSVLDGARSKVDLRGEGYAWTPIVESNGLSYRGINGLIHGFDVFAWCHNYTNIIVCVGHWKWISD